MTYIFLVTTDIIVSAHCEIINDVVEYYFSDSIHLVSLEIANRHALLSSQTI